jgi:hypothetical protein
MKKENPFVLFLLSFHIVTKTSCGRTTMLRWIARFKQAVLGTAVAINLFLASSLVARELVPIEEALPSVGQPSVPHIYVEYAMEPTGVTREGDYLIEHYREMELQYNSAGILIKKIPTEHEEHLRYYRPQK